MSAIITCDRCGKQYRIGDIAPDTLDCRSCRTRILTARSAATNAALADGLHETLAGSLKMAWLAFAILSSCAVLGLVNLVCLLTVFPIRPPAGIVLLLAMTVGLAVLAGYYAVKVRRYLRSRERAQLLAALRVQRIFWAALCLLGGVGLALQLLFLLGVA